MKRPDEKVLKALCNLENDADFAIVRRWVLESSQSQEQVLRQAESTPVLYRAQGAVKELLEFCEITATPRDLAKKLASNAGGYLPG